MADFISLTIDNKAVLFDKKEVKKVVRQAGVILKKTAQEYIRASDSSGRMYGKHQASGAGQSPNNLVGILANSIHIKTSKSGLAAIITDDATAPNGKYSYALSLEGGSVGGGGGKTFKGKTNIRNKGHGKSGKMGSNVITPSTIRKQEPRPFLSKAIEAKSPELDIQIRQALLLGVKLKDVRNG